MSDIQTDPGRSVRALPTGPRSRVVADATGGDGVEVVVARRRSVRSPADVLWLLMALGLLGLGIVVARWGGQTVRGFEADLLVQYQRVPGRVAEAFTGLVWFLAGAVPVVAVLVLLFRREFLRAALLVVVAKVALLLVATVVSYVRHRDVITAVEERLGPGSEVALGGVGGSPLVASAVAMVVVASSWVRRSWRVVLWWGMVALVVARVVSAGPPLDLVTALAIGMAVGSLALLAVGRPSGDPSGDALLALVRQAGEPVRIVQTRMVNPLAYRVEMRVGPALALRLSTSYDESADRLEGLWRWARLRRGQTERPFSTLGRRVEHEALVLTLAAKAGVRVRDVHAVVNAPGLRAGLLLDDLPGEPVPPGGDISPALLHDLWEQIKRLHDARIAHRDLSLDHVTVTPGEQAVVDGFGGARLSAGDRDMALDTAQLLVDIGLRVGPEAAVEAAAATLGHDRMVAAVPFLQPLALPAATRRRIRDDRQVLTGLRQAIEARTGVDLPPLERLDRIRPRTALSILALTAAFYALLPQLARAQDTARVAAGANWWWVAPILLGSAVTYLAATVAFVATAPGPVRFWSAFRLQVASSFLGVVAPANAGRMAGAVRFLQRAGFEPGAATASVALNNVGAVAVHVVLMMSFLAWMGTGGVGGFSLPDANTVLLVVAVAVPALGLLSLVAPVRRRVLRPLLGHVQTGASTLARLMTDPARMLGLFGGSAGVTLAYMATLLAAVEAFGGGVSVPQVGAAYLVAAALASASPTPGGLGALEAALVAGLSGYGMADSSAIPAVLTFRLATYWLPIAPGWVTFHLMQRQEEL